jgi:hypothetical protein
VGSLFMAWLVEKFGRKRNIHLGYFLSVLGGVLQRVAATWAYMIPSKQHKESNWQSLKDVLSRSLHFGLWHWCTCHRLFHVSFGDVLIIQPQVACWTPCHFSSGWVHVRGMDWIWLLFCDSRQAFLRMAIPALLQGCLSSYTPDWVASVASFTQTVISKGFTEEAFDAINI